MLVRRETADDVPAVREVVRAAFAGPGGGEPVEVRLLDRLRTGQEWRPELSLVAEAADRSVAGHVVCSRAWVGEREVVGLGPLAVRPDRQRRGVGSALVHAVVGAAEALDVEAVVLLGSTDYYPRYGFVAGTSVGIVPPEPAWGEHFQARLLGTRPHPRGAFRYARAFHDLG